MLIKHEWSSIYGQGSLMDGHNKRKLWVPQWQFHFNTHQRSVWMAVLNVIQHIYRSKATVLLPCVQGAFLPLHCPFFVSASSCFCLSSANNARVLFLFEEAAWVPIGREGGGVEMEAVAVRDSDIGLGEPISTLHSWSSLSHTHTHNGLQETHWRLLVWRRRGKERWRCPLSSH